MFDQIVSENTARTRRPLAVALSFSGQALLVLLSVLFPVLRTATIVTGRLSRVISAPPNGTSQPTPRKPSGARLTGKPGPRIFTDPMFRQPARVPPGILQDESEPPSTLSAGLAIPGAQEGVPGGTGINLAEIPKIPPPKPIPPAAPAERVVLTIGGNVQAAKIRRQVIPVYPPLARQARISGTVRLEAVIARNGTIESLRVISGHHFLAQAALEAVRQWSYYPTLLNGDPVAVLTEIEVNFKLGE